MSIWVRISDFVSTKATTALSGLVETVRTAFAGDPATRRRVAFSIAMIALSAKMAKADGVVTNSEVDAFREIFEIPADDARRVAGLYNLAKQDVAGYRAYAAQVASLCGTGSQDCPLLIDVLDGLFHIAKADGVIHSKELDFLTDVAGIFGISGNAFERIVLIAPPRVLGELRDKMHKEVSSRVVADMPKDLTNHPLDKVEKLLKSELDPTA